MHRYNNTIMYIALLRLPKDQGFDGSAQQHVNDCKTVVEKSQQVVL